MKLSPRIQFLIRNGLKGFAWMFLLLAVYFLFKEILVSNNLDSWIERFYTKPQIIYIIYFSSEFFFGIIPPELFMIWAFHKGGVLHYFMNVGFFAVVSYAMGYITFLIGQFLYKKSSFLYIRNKFFKNSMPLLKKYVPIEFSALIYCSLLVRGCLITYLTKSKALFRLCNE